MRRRNFTGTTLLVAALLTSGSAIADCSLATSASNDTNIMARIDALAACVGSLQARVDRLEAAVLISEIPCTDLGEGWQLYAPVEGRFIIGVGGQYKFSDTGGEESVALSVEQMPSHNHVFVGTTESAGGQSGNLQKDVGAGDHLQQRTYTPSGTIEATGGNQDHNNMPPYFAMYFCKKS